MTAPNNLIPFSLQDAIAGKPLCTRDGREVTEFKYFEEVTNNLYSCAAVVNGKIETFTKAGSFHESDTSFDLFLAPQLQERWQNVSLGFMEGLFPSKQKADEYWKYDLDTPRTHYLVTYWGEDGVIVPELSKWIPINNDLK